jgi:hypothetical protein
MGSSQGSWTSDPSLERFDFVDPSFFKAWAVNLGAGADSAPVVLDEVEALLLNCGEAGRLPTLPDP